MKKIYFYITILSTLLLLSSCNDEWKDELYVRLVSFKAPINKDDVSVIYLRYQPDGEVIYQLPVVISGSQENDKNYDIKIAVDNDTLAVLNYARYTDRKDLYYQQFKSSSYELPSPTCHIPAGTDVGLFDVKFKFSGLDLVEKWVLPLTIEKDDSYTMNMYQGRRKALLWVLPFNDYSGRYSSTGMSVYYGNETTNHLVVGTREAMVVDEKTIFFYAGIMEERDEHRTNYKVIVKFEDPIKPEGEEGNDITAVIKGKLTVTSDNPNMKFELLGEATYEIKQEMDIAKPHIKKQFITINMKYKYEDYTSSPTRVFPYRCEGSMIMQRNKNTLVPDQDQAIIW